MVDSKHAASWGGDDNGDPVTSGCLRLCDTYSSNLHENVGLDVDKNTRLIFWLPFPHSSRNNHTCSSALSSSGDGKRNRSPSRIRPPTPSAKTHLLLQVSEIHG
jgi:hypothetical protein